MNPIAFDTLKYANRLKLAEALDAHQAELATKSDIAEVWTAPPQERVQERHRRAKDRA